MFFSIVKGCRIKFHFSFGPVAFTTKKKNNNTVIVTAAIRICDVNIAVQFNFTNIAFLADFTEYKHINKLYIKITTLDYILLLLFYHHGTRILLAYHLIGNISTSRNHIIVKKNPIMEDCILLFGL